MKCVLLPILGALSISGCTAPVERIFTPEEPRFDLTMKVVPPKEDTGEPKYIVSFIPRRSGEDVVRTSLIVTDATWIAHSKRSPFDMLEPLPLGDERDKEPTTHDYLSSGSFVAMRCARETSSTFRVTVRIYEFEQMKISWRVEREIVVQEDESVPL